MADLNLGNAFAEGALIANGEPAATITKSIDGPFMRLAKEGSKEFIQPTF
ncbi:MAG: hypothetical protein ACU84Q_07265 [Gammaproteobacteria bacterium]